MQGVSLTARDLTLQMFIAFSMLMLYILEVIRAESYRLQEGLRVSEARFRLLAVSSRDAILLVNLEAKVLVCLACGDGNAGMGDRTMYRA